MDSATNDQLRCSNNFQINHSDWEKVKELIEFVRPLYRTKLRWGWRFFIQYHTASGAYMNEDLTVKLQIYVFGFPLRFFSEQVFRLIPVDRVIRVRKQQVFDVLKHHLPKGFKIIRKLRKKSDL